jgi:hypothetical protein
MEALGRLFDFSTGFSPVDMQTAANTGKRVGLKNCAGVTILFIKAAGTAGDDPVLTLNEHTASSGGTSQVLAELSKYYQKQETTLDGDEQWTEVTQAAASTITFNATSAESEALYAIELDGTQLSDGFDYISVDVADVGGNAQLGTVLYVLRDLTVQRDPTALVAPLS